MQINEVTECEVNNQLGCLSLHILKIHIFTARKSDGHDCDITAIENLSARISNDSKINALFKVEDSDVTFVVDFDSNKAVINKINYGDATGLCGINGSFSGKWKKAK